VDGDVRQSLAPGAAGDRALSLHARDIATISLATLANEGTEKSLVFTSAPQVATFSNEIKTLLFKSLFLCET
jgi:hypothetical protein